MKLALGTCTSGYSDRLDELDPSHRHTIGVDWQSTDISRAVIKNDLLNTLNGAMTIFQATKNNAEVRLRAVLETGSDPGNAAAPGVGTPISVGEEIVDPTPAPSLQAIRDRVTTHLRETSPGTL
ncbi:MAG TPA: hypothetical protein VIW24_01230 [Aldersonia sp.]